jgi:hypothetical protein
MYIVLYCFIVWFTNISKFTTIYNWEAPPSTVRLLTIKNLDALHSYIVKYIKSEIQKTPDPNQTGSTKFRKWMDRNFQNRKPTTPKKER